jgi:hypothetical protein
MVDIIALKTSIYNQLSAVMTTYEDGRVSKNAVMPYVTYALGVSVEGNVDSFEAVSIPLELNLFDHNMKKDTDRIEGLVNELDAALAYTDIIETVFYYRCSREGINAGLPTTDEFTFRRELRYTLKIYLKESE